MSMNVKGKWQDSRRYFGLLSTPVADVFVAHQSSLMSRTPQSTRYTSGDNRLHYWRTSTKHTNTYRMLNCFPLLLSHFSAFSKPVPYPHLRLLGPPVSKASPHFSTKIILQSLYTDLGRYTSTYATFDIENTVINIRTVILNFGSSIRGLLSACFVNHQDRLSSSNARHIFPKKFSVTLLPAAYFRSPQWAANRADNLLGSDDGQDVTDLPMNFLSL